ncbi:MAG: hypothetical protein IPH65_09125 [Dehalococcoidia bacterium]|uniref:ribbon-helix-helix domain-containing protein n=1 Tax=Candidatus Amarobacter glycogenicus TaxID=3140699 RepID=UPI0031375890|nr:hypothetical protein [Dehalococcoidia bacterium]MBK7126052.1 hypothetical protein [Dehalococcoidia bacterium]MCC6269182.1 hypothetical protein [Dehalococcoidia bacterium]
MQVRIPDDLASDIQECVERGSFASAQEFVDVAVRRLAEDEREYWNGIQKKIEAGIASLDARGGTPWTPDLAARVISDARQEWSAREVTSG